MTQRALLVIDLQNDYFPGGNWTLSGVEAAAANAVRVLAAARSAGDTVIHVRHENLGAGAPFFVPGSEGAQFHPSLLPAEGEPVILKHHINSFRETELAQMLERQGVTEVTVVGAMSHLCIDGFTRAASDLGYQVTVIHDACASRDLEFNGTLVPAAHVHAAFMAALGFAYAKLTATADYLA